MAKRAATSLLPTTVRRSLSMGRLYIVLGTVISVFLAIVLVRSPHAVFATTYPLEVPLFAILGSTGGILVFSGDRTKGVFEYLIAYGVKPVTLFVNGLLAAITVSTIMLGAILALGLGIFFGHGGVNTLDLDKSLGLYSVPMTYAGTVFFTTVAMYWAALATPRMGMNSPVGIAPLLGVGPTILILLVAETSPVADFYYITAGGAGVVGAASVVLIVLSGKLMSRERFLSPM
ncbi:MAG: hypothetical protein ACRECT_01785 [Thermoplasmata archaeon]